MTAAVAPGVLAALVGGPVRSLERLKGGYSREMWSFDAELDGRDRPLILCADLATGVVDSADSLGREAEAELLAGLHGAGLPVPGVLTSGGGASPLGCPFLVMDRVPGTASVGPLLREPHHLARRDALGAQLANVLAAVHAVDLPGVVGPSPRPDEVAPREVARWARALDTVPAARTPAVRAAQRWLDGHLPPPPERVVLVHGDYRTGNVVHGPEGFRAVLDWEMAHAGDPLEDLAFAALSCWRLGTGLIGALVPADRWVELYERAAGRPVDGDALEFWTVLGAVKMVALTRRVLDLLGPSRERVLLRRLAAQLDDDLRDAGSPRTPAPASLQ